MQSYVLLLLLDTPAKNEVEPKSAAKNIKRSQKDRLYVVFKELLLKPVLERVRLITRDNEVALAAQHFLQRQHILSFSETS
jgi:hypothetical protein